MAYTYSYTGTGTADEIIHISFVDDFNLVVTFKSHGKFCVNKIFSQSAFSDLAKMQAGQKVLLAQNQDRIMWVKPLESK